MFFSSVCHMVEEGWLGVWVVGIYLLVPVWTSSLVVGEVRGPTGDMVGSLDG